MTQRSIVETVLATRPPTAHGRWLVALSVGLGVHVVLVLAAWRVGPTLETWAADLAIRVHTDLARIQVVELPAPPPPEAPVQAKEEPPQEPEVTKPVPEPKVRRESARAPSRPRPHPAAKVAPSPPSEAGRVLAADPAAPVDLTGEVVVSGEGSTYAGGATSRSGTSRTAGSSVAKPRASSAGSAPLHPDRSQAPRPVYPDWDCPWPDEADALAIDRESAVVRVQVDVRGHVIRVEVLDDPGHGFGAAAAECARRAKFVAGRDRDGRRVAAVSPPVRVRFTR